MTKPPFLNEDLYCTSCWYNLRGLKPDGDCPECNYSIAKTRLEREADPLSTGATLGGTCFVFTVANAIFAVIALSDPISEFAVFGAIFWLLIACPLYFFGLFLTLWLIRHRPLIHKLSRRAIVLGLLFGAMATICNLFLAMRVIQASASV